LKNIDEHLLEIHNCEGTGYKPLIDYDKWRVAILRYNDELLPERIITMQRHNETDEVFVLLDGRCILFIGEVNDTISSITGIDLEPQKIYNVKRGVWHSHTLSNDASVLIVENRDTTNQNSPKKFLNDDQRQRLIEITRELWQA
jgi:ureidoglycolate hydrolase